jgi:hypothetical protein
MSAEMVAEVRSTLERDAHRDNVQWLLDQMKTVRDLISTEMKWRVYAYIPAEKAKYFTEGKPQLLGEEVHKRSLALETMSMKPVTVWRLQGRLLSSTLCGFPSVASPL